MRNSSTAQSDRLLMWLLWHLTPLLLTSLLILWLDGGFPPANWQLLAEALINASAYKAAQGTSMSTVLSILGVQSLLLLLVWIGLLVLTLRDVFALLRGPDRFSVVRLPAAPDASLTIRGRTASTVRKASEALRSPFENLSRQRQQNGTITLGKNGSVNSTPARKALPAAPQLKPSGMQAGAQMAVPQILPPKQELPVPDVPLRTPGRPADPFDMQPDILDLFAQPEFLDTPALKADRPGLHPAQAQAQPQAQPGRAAQPEFVFGNPFEGPLPEVFEYDADLKQSLVDLKPKNRP